MISKSQVLDLRLPIPEMVRTADQYTQGQYLAKCRRALSTQTVRFAVAPDQCFVTQSGRRFAAGEEVTLEDVKEPGRQCWQSMRDAVLRGLVLEKDMPEPHDAA